MNKLFTMNVNIPLIVFLIYKLWGDSLYVTEFYSILFHTIANTIIIKAH